MSAPFSKAIVYHTSLAWQRDGLGILNAPDRPPLPVAPPIQFGGPGDQWTPEELLVGSVEACAMATFFALARRQGLTVVSYASTASGTLGKGEHGWAFVSVDLSLRIAVKSESDRELAARIAQRAHETCFVGNSLRCPVAVDFVVSVEEPSGIDVAMAPTGLA